MQTTITARHEEIPDDLKERAGQVIERLAKRTTRPTSVHIVFDNAAPGATAEIILSAARGATYVAKADATDHRSALDRALAKLQRQLDKAEQSPKARKRRVAAS